MVIIGVNDGQSSAFKGVLGLHAKTSIVGPASGGLFHESQRNSSRKEDRGDAGVLQVFRWHRPGSSTTCRLSHGDGPSLENYKSGEGRGWTRHRRCMFHLWTSRSY